MMNCNQNTNEDTKNINDAASFESKLSEELELFRRAIYEALDLKIRKIEEEIKDIEISPSSERRKKWMRRIIPERAAAFFYLYCVDNFMIGCSKLIIKLKTINFSIDVKERRRKNEKSARAFKLTRTFLIKNDFMLVYS